MNAVAEQIPIAESLRRALDTVEFAQRELAAARFADSQRKLGLDVVAPDVAAAEARLLAAQEKASAISAEISATQTAEQAALDAEQQRIEQAHRLAVEAADSDVLSARRAADVAALDRLSAAQSGASDGVYAAKVQKSLDADARLTEALARRDAL